MGWTMEEQYVGTILDEYMNLKEENEKLKISLQVEQSNRKDKPCPMDDL